MFNRRRRSYRKGPPANQIYVPHDQRKLTADPIPIMTEKQAQYYYNQLKDMGYIPEPVDNYTPNVLLLTRANPANWLYFHLDYDQSVKNSNINATNCNVYDMNGNELDKNKYDLVNILNQNGYKLYPVLCRSQLGFVNTTNSSKNLTKKYLDNNTSTNVSVAANSYYGIGDAHPQEWRAGYPINQEDIYFWVDYDDMATTATPFMYQGSSFNFQFASRQMICFVTSQ